MTISRTMVFVGAIAMWGGGGVLAQDGRAAPQEPAMPTAQDEQREALLKGYEAAVRGEAIRVTLELRNATVQQAVEQFRRQVPSVSFVADYTNWAEEYRIDEFLIREVPWRDAFDAFLAKVGGMIDEEKAGVIRFSKPARLTFSLKDADIKNVLDLIARVAKANIIVSPQVAGKITLMVNDVPWNALLDTVVKTLGNYTVVHEKFDILRIINAEELKKQMETQAFPLVYIQAPSTYLAAIDESKQVKGKPIAPPTTVEDLVKNFSLLNMLRAVLTRDNSGTVLGRLDYDPASNTVVATDTKPVLAHIKEIISVVDVPPEQVQIDVKFVSTKNEDLLTFGVNWVGASGEGGFEVSTRPLEPLPRYSDITGYGSTGGLPLGPVTKLPWGLGSEYQTGREQFFLTSYQMIATFRAFKKDKFTRLMQQPTISALNNEPATIFVGETISYAESKASSNQFGSLEFTIAEGSKSPVKVGFQLLVVPRILSKENKVIMTVIPVNEVLNGSSSAAKVAGFEHFEIAGLGAGGATVSIDLPRVASTTLVSKLMVESGRTAILGGLVTERVTYEDLKLPFLGDLPFLNPLFRRRGDSVTREHLLVFVTPRIVRSARESEENLRTQLRALEEEERKNLEQMRLEKQKEELRRQEEEKAKKVAEELKKLEEQKK